MTGQADIVVVGLGVGGEQVAGKLAEAGLSVVGIERRLVGGECPYWGCIPSKMMIRAANLLAETRRVDGLAGHATADTRLGAGGQADPGRGHRQLGRQGRGRPVHRQGRHVRPRQRPFLVAGPVDVDGTTYTAPEGHRDRHRHRARRFRRSTGWRHAVLDEPTGDRDRDRAIVADRASAAARSGSSWRRCSPGSASR